MESRVKSAILAGPGGVARDKGKLNCWMWLDVPCGLKEPALEGAEQSGLRVERKTVDRLNEHEFCQSAADGNFVGHEELGAIDGAPDEWDVHRVRESFDDI